MKKYFLVLCMSVVAFSAINAQKFGYVNSQELLANMPEIKTADTDLETYKSQLLSKGQSMVQAFEVEYKKYMEESQAGLLSQVKAAEKEADLGKQQQEIQAYETEVQTKLLEKRELLYKPILDKVKMTIETYGKSNGYTMIFDSSAGSILYGLEVDNLMTAITAEIKK